jgi:hypothetical protein
VLCDFLVESAGEFGSKAIIGSVSKDEGLQVLVEPVGDDGCPFIDPWLNVIESIAANEAEEGMFAGDGASEWCAGLARL